jgi:hypothetical protein
MHAAFGAGYRPSLRQKATPLHRRPKGRASSTHSATSLSLETRLNLLNLPIARAWTLLHGLRLCPALFKR